MDNVATKIVIQFLESQDVEVVPVKENVLFVGWGFEGGSIKIFFQFDETDTHVHLEGADFIKIPEDKYEKMYKVINECNAKYSHIKFVLDSENGQIVARDDDVIQLDSCGPECMELMLRMVKVVEDAYPTIMKALWA